MCNHYQEVTILDTWSWCLMLMIACCCCWLSTYPPFGQVKLRENGMFICRCTSHWLCCLRSLPRKWDYFRMNNKCILFLCYKFPSYFLSCGKPFVGADDLLLFNARRQTPESGMASWQKKNEHAQCKVLKAAWKWWPGIIQLNCWWVVSIILTWWLRWWSPWLLIKINGTGR